MTCVRRESGKSLRPDVACAKSARGSAHQAGVQVEHHAASPTGMAVSSTAATVARSWHLFDAADCPLATR